MLIAVIYYLPQLNVMNVFETFDRTIRFILSKYATVLSTTTTIKTPVTLTALVELNDAKLNEQRFSPNAKN